MDATAALPADAGHGVQDGGEVLDRHLAAAGPRFRRLGEAR
ncbi:hypothetical protein [Actinomadura madurae]